LENSKIRFLDNIDHHEVNRAFFLESNLKRALIKGDMHGVIFSLHTLPDETTPRYIHCAGLQKCNIAGWTYDTHIESALPSEWLTATFGDATVNLTEEMPRPGHWPDWELPSDGDNSYDIEWRKWQANILTYVPPPAPKG
jgi:hypothetical protein